MGTTTEKLQAILNSKADIKDAIEQKGVEVGSTPLSGYAQKILDIPTGDTDGMNGFLSVESKTIPTSPTQTINIAYNPKCGIMDENNELWDVLDWHQRWVDNGYSASGLSKPTGIWMEAFGLELKYLWPIVMEYKTYDTTGTNIKGANVCTHCMYNVSQIITATSGTAYPAVGNVAHGTAGKYNSADWQSSLNGDGIDYYSANTKETFHLASRDIGNAYAFVKDNNEEYMEGYYQQTEFFRACFAICSGIATNETNGTTTTVEILNSTGQQAAVNEDMYFWIGGTNTGLKAKYNLNSRLTDAPNAYLLTQAIADAIYDKQKANGVNMNDTGVNSTNRHILFIGAKGAEAVAVDGYWYIKTPVITSPNTAANASYNIQDAQVVYACKYLGVSIPTERMLYPYYLNKNTLITAIVNMLIATEGLTDVPTVLGTSVWSSIRYNASSVWYTGTNTGPITSTPTSIGLWAIPCPLSSTQFIKHTTT